jgi:hypothetical protein
MRKRFDGLCGIVRNEFNWDAVSAEVFLFPTNNRNRTTCKKQDINPYEWLKSAFEAIQEYPINKLSDLLPENFKS